MSQMITTIGTCNEFGFCQRSSVSTSEIFSCVYVDHISLISFISYKQRKILALFGGEIHRGLWRHPFMVSCCPVTYAIANNDHDMVME